VRNAPIASDAGARGHGRDYLESGILHQDLTDLRTAVVREVDEGARRVRLAIR
jgi:hypothetical protein